MDAQFPRQPLDYQKPHGTRWVTVAWQLLAGVAAGTAFSITFWWFSWPHLLKLRQVLYVVLLLATFKTVVGVALLTQRGLRGCGVGVLLSVLTGAVFVVLLVAGEGLKVGK